MNKPAEIELIQLKKAVDYLAGIFEEGSLVAQYDQGMREEVANILRLLLNKVEGLPVGTPEHLIQAAAVRAIIGAAELEGDAAHAEQAEKVKHHMGQAEIYASLRGHILGEWERSADADTELEYQAICQNCDGIIYVNPTDVYTLMSDECRKEEPTEKRVIAEETIVALWDLAQN